jgi:hypothetical protein
MTEHSPGSARTWRRWPSKSAAAWAKNHNSGPPLAVAFQTPGASCERPVSPLAFNVQVHSPSTITEGGAVVAGTRLLAPVSGHDPRSVEDCHAVESKERRSQIRSDAAHARLVCGMGRENQRPQDAFGKLATARQGAADRRVVQRVLPKRLDSRRCRALRLSIQHAGDPDHSCCLR